MAKCTTTLKIFVLTFSMFGSSALHAEYFGSLSGRTAKFTAQPKMTVEAAFASGGFVDSDYQQAGFRFNYQYSPKVVLFGDIGQSELNDSGDASFGFGGYYALSRPLLWSDNSAIKMSLHQVNFAKRPGQTNCGADITYIDPWTGILIYIPGACTTGPDRGGKIRNIAVDLLISGTIRNPIISDRVDWYANGGIQMFDGDFTDDTVLGIGSGVVFPLQSTEFYAGWEYADELFIGIGFRYFVK